MNKIELLEKIDLMIAKAKNDESNAENNIAIAYYSGQQNGLSRARSYILCLKEK